MSEHDSAVGAAVDQVGQARRAQEVAEEATRFGQLLLVLSEALSLTTTVQEIATTVTDVVAAQLGAAGGGLLLADATGTTLDFVSMDQMPPGTEAAWARIDVAADAPLALAVRTRQPVFYADDAALIGGHPRIGEHGAVPAMGASANIPLLVGAQVVGAVFAYWDRPHRLPAQQLQALAALGRYTAQAVHRATLLAERRSAAEILQRSMLTELPQPDDLEIRARYVPAAVGEDVGGDWYDAVITPDGATTLVIGDVTGHDMAAAAHMGQLRGLLRAFAYDRDEPPAQVVARLDRTLAGLGIEGLATLIVARIEQTAADAARGLRRVRWTNAGHPPPVLLLADGEAQVLDDGTELLVGVFPQTERCDRVAVLPPGSTLLLYTDGLIEHRGRPVTEGLQELQRVLSLCRDCSVEELLEHVVRELVGPSPEDDCAILAVRAHPQHRPAP